MPSLKIATAAALLAAIPSVTALGAATITNNCDFPVYLWSVSNEDGPMHTLDGSGGSYSETYRTNPDGGGISIKLANVDSLYTGAPITQFEYTLDGPLWYDVSNINGYPFANGGLTVTPSDAGCPTVDCPAGVTLCKSVYNAPHNDWATGACTESADIEMVICANGSSGSDNDSSPPPKKKSPSPPPAGTTTEQPPPPAETTTEQPAPPPAPTTKKQKPKPAPTTTTQDDPAPVVTTLVTQVVTQPVNVAANAAPASSVDTDWWIGHYPASWASFPVETDLQRREAKPTAHAHHHHHHLRHAHGHHHRR